MAATKDYLAVPLSEKLGRAVGISLAEQLWPERQAAFGVYSSPYIQSFINCYLDYYDRQCQMIGEWDHGTFASVNTHRDITTIAQWISEPLARCDVRKLMCDKLGSSDQDRHDMSINLVSRLLLMMRVGNIPHEVAPRMGTVDWEKGDLRHFIQQHFSQKPFTKQRAPGRMKLEKQFNALNIWRIANVQIWWTENLAEHLLMANGDEAVLVFKHASFLKYHENNPLYPNDFISETLRTIALLCPRNKKNVRKWYENELKQSGQLDPYVMEMDSLDTASRTFDNFFFWHDRLVVLKQVYDESTPSTLRQLYYDDRIKTSYSIFWFSAIVIPLTVVGIFLAVLQAIFGGVALSKG